MSTTKDFYEALKNYSPTPTFKEMMRAYKDIMEGDDDSWDDLMDEIDDRGHVDMDKFRFPTRAIKPPVKNKVCGCGKDEHGFATHADFCPKYDPDKDGNGGI